MPGLNLWNLLRNFFRRTTTNLIITPPAAGGTVRVHQGGVAPTTTNYGEVSHDGTNVVLKNSKDALNVGKFLFLSSDGSYNTGLVVAQVRVGGVNASNYDVAGPGLGSTGVLAWSSNSDGAAAKDTGLKRVAAGVVATTDGSSGAGWLQNTPGTKRVTADVTNATTTFSNITDLSVTLIAGRKYIGKAVIYWANSVNSEGIKFDFNGGSATMTSFRGAEVLFGGTAGGVTNAGSTIHTALNTSIGWNTSTGEQCTIITFTMVCNAGGTFIPRFAENAHAIGTATVQLGSYITLQDSPS